MLKIFIRRFLNCLIIRKNLSNIKNKMNFMKYRISKELPTLENVLLEDIEKKKKGGRKRKNDSDINPNNKKRKVSKKSSDESSASSEDSSFILEKYKNKDDKKDDLMDEAIGNEAMKQNNLDDGQIDIDDITEDHEKIGKKKR